MQRFAEKVRGGRMTHPIFTDFERIESAANATPKGADHKQIIRTLAAKYDVTEDEVRKIILDNTIQGPS